MLYLYLIDVALPTIYPEHKWDLERLKRNSVEKGHWLSKDNQRKFLEDFAKKMSIYKIYIVYTLSLLLFSPCDKNLETSSV
jgi:hypothetical protein